MDTNTIIALFKGNKLFLDRLRSHHVMDFGISSVVVHELFYGAYKSQRQSENLQRVDNLQFEIVHFISNDARWAGKLRAKLARNGTPIGPYDILIAGQAVSRNLILLTNNTREFQRVEELKIEDWTI
ncbi:type II toxin-antitoxin system VapC family toxin [Desulfonatronovibrio magnus]|uniref:type II toxin-antitoxin system VapC family toxin n=1 Tax=Desulfonatronovibrio magnus TaxID=698827 RepID=UPI001E47D4EE|nr:type II toxin-antitoxin system VapC family toxin [Desulfonatronovibrio magnus]